MALSRAKNDSRGTFSFFEAEMDARAQSRRKIEIDLRESDPQRRAAAVLPAAGSILRPAASPASKRWCAGRIPSAA